MPASGYVKERVTHGAAVDVQQIEANIESGLLRRRSTDARQPFGIHQLRGKIAGATERHVDFGGPIGCHLDRVIVVPDFVAGGANAQAVGPWTEPAARKRIT